MKIIRMIKSVYDNPQALPGTIYPGHLGLLPHRRTISSSVSGTGINIYTNNSTVGAAFFVPLHRQKKRTLRKGRF